MAEEVAALVVRLEARVNQYEKNLVRARKKTNQQLGYIDKRIRRTGGSFDGLTANVKRLAAGLTAAKIVAYADSFKTLQNNIKQVASDTTDVEKTTDSLFRVAQRSRTSLAAIGATFRDVTVATDGLGISQQRIVRIVETLAKSAPGATGAIRQLGQGLASGALRGEELTSVLEGAPRLARAIADEFKTSIGQLKVLGEEGSLTTERVLKAVEAYQQKADALIEKQSLTVRQSLTQLDNAFTVFIGGQDSALGASQALANGIKLLADNLDTLADAFVVIGTVIAGRYLSAAVTPALLGTLNLAAGVQTLGVRAAGSAVAMRGLSAAMAFFGGPIGLAFTAIAGAVYAISQRTDEAKERFERLVQPIGNVEAAIDAVEQAAREYSKAIADNANTQTDATASIVASTKKEFEAKKSLLELERERKSEAIKSRAAEIAGLKAGVKETTDIGSYLGALGYNEDQIAEMSADPIQQKVFQSRIANLEGVSVEDRQRQEAERKLRASRLKELEAVQALEEISLQRTDDILSKSFEDIASGSKITPSVTKTPGKKKSKSKPRKSPAETAAEKLADAKLAEARASEDLGEAVQALGGYEDARVKLASDALEIEENRLAVERAREDILRGGGSQELADATARTLELEQQRSVALDLLTEKEREAADVARTAAEEKKKQAEELQAALEKAKEARIEEEKESAKAFADGLLSQIDAHLKYNDALETAAAANHEKELERLKDIKDARDAANKALADGLASALSQADSFDDALEKISEQLIKIAAQGFFEGGFGVKNAGASGGGLGGAFASIGSSLFGGLLSLDGGGFTGRGSRSGGVDGRGGFPAILHPNETVIDHTRGQSVGGNITVVGGSVTLNGNTDKGSLRKVEQMLQAQTEQTIAEIDRRRVQGLA